ncbi:hypothetical protein GPECTOR_56g366 [Gonium pectorale]|uniref:Radical SAM core domain-containing protein n=1 Tax=Gonium pectorale TaxID=33097 RepID=A0A150G7F1_GONPE|nr:hypothetical protein GPECTOR_56g366 [Gonium pectorale]|eukprot:KXZ45270.1 hypothetical protein GPECTOR_56g366 [Gonium pectorale]
MPPPRKLNPQSVWDTSAVLQAFQEEGIKPMHAVRIWGHMIRNPGSSWHDVPDVPRAAVALLDKYFVRFTTRVVKCQNSSDGSTTKLLVELQDGMQVEAVIMTYEAPSRDPQLLASGAPEVDPHLPVDHRAAAEEEEDEREEGAAAQRPRQRQQEAPGRGAARGSGDGSSCGGGGGNAGGAGESGNRGGEAEPSSSAPSVTSAAAARLRRRSTLCVSSQVGCQMGCTFCATGTMGLKGHLNAGEIVEQLMHARAVTRIRNIVFMGMGEPLNNYEAVRSAVSMMTDSRYFGLRRRHVTVSTVGVIPRIKQLAQDLPGVSLALSLHAPNQELRAKIVPSARAYKLPALMDAVRSYQANSSQRVFYEYVMLSGVNDGLEQAHELGKLLQGDDVVVNLIPWNPVYQPEGPFFEAPQDGSVAAFQSVLRHTYGLHTTVRQEMGQDISGACGQLVIETGGGGGGGCSREATKDIEDAVRKVKLGPVA